MSFRNIHIAIVMGLVIISSALLDVHPISLALIVITFVFIFYMKQQNQMMSRARKYYTNVFEHATEGIILADEKARIYLVNPAARQMFGYEEPELLGKPIELLIPSRYQHSHTQHQKDFYHDPQVRRMGQGRDLAAVRKDGTEFPVEVSLSYFKDGDRIFVIAFIMDITLRKQAEERLIKVNTDLLQLNEEATKLNEQLEDKVTTRTLMLQEALKQVEISLEKEKELSDIKSRFVSMASHEFRTPLSTVLFSASLLAKYVTTEEQEKRTRHVLKIKESVRHLNNILEDFLSLGKLNEGNVQAVFHDFFIKELVEDIIEEMKSQLKPGQQIELDCNEVPAIFSDSKLVKNSIINLLSNAIKYSAEDSIVRVSILHRDNLLQVNITDHGIGIPQEDIPHLFTSFFRGKNVSTIKGTGLGLLIVKRYMDILGGSILVESKIDEGTQVTILIPNHQKANNHEQLDPGSG